MYLKIKDKVIYKMDAYCDCSEFQSWSEIYFTQLFTILGQLSAVIIGGTVAIPMFSYYSNSLNKMFKTE